MHHLIGSVGRAVACFALGSIGLYVYARQSLPISQGRRTVKGIGAPVEITRDRDNIPHIYAQDKQDSLFGLGYVHASDRLWQMEFQRRVGQGRLSEIFGERTVKQDQFCRTIGMNRAGLAAWENASPDLREAVEFYIAGINAYLADCSFRNLSPEFQLLRFKPEPWIGPDVLAWIKMIAWQMGGNCELELLRRDLIAAVGPLRTQELVPDYPADGPTIVQSSRSDAPVRTRQGIEDKQEAIKPSAQVCPAEQVLRQSQAHFLDSFGSNSWVVDGSKSDSGLPLLASDPHLGLNAPSLWYLAHLSAGEFDVIGATIPGLPGVVIGRNKHIAWGMSNMNPDVQDLFREHLDEHGEQAEYQGRFEPLEVINEVIGVRGRPAILHKVRISRHGPLINDIIESPTGSQGGVLALSWTALEKEDESITAFLGINAAQNWHEFHEALRLFGAPAQNFLYADVAGNIAYQASGRIPLRGSGDGNVPREGWTGAGDWVAWVPFEELPHVFNPPEHFIVSANQKPLPDDNSPFLGSEWSSPYRARRIQEVLRSQKRFGSDDFAAMHGDTVSLLARDLLPPLLLLTRPRNAHESQVVSILRTWDYDMRGDSAAAAIFGVWFRRLVGAILLDELGEELFGQYSWRFQFVARFLTNCICHQSGIPDDVDMETVASQTFAESVKELSDSLGNDVAHWRWDRLHRLHMVHQGFGSVPILQRLFNRTRPSGGDASVINVGPYGPTYRQYGGAAYRQVVDLAEPGGQFIHSLGQSGNLLSRHYSDYLADWSAVRYHPMRFQRDDVKRAAQATLILEPSNPING